MQSSTTVETTPPTAMPQAAPIELTLDQLKPGDCCRVVSHSDDPAAASVVRRLRDLGFRDGESVDVVRRAPMRDPMVFRVCDYDVCLRRSEARLLNVTLAS